MSKYTPGPWKWSNKCISPAFLKSGTSKEPVIEVKDYWVGESGCGQDLRMEIEKANALLISKAPEMYEMLKELEWRGSDHYALCPICQKARCGPNSDPKSIFYKGGHSPDCKLGNLLEELNELEASHEKL